MLDYVRRYRSLTAGNRWDTIGKLSSLVGIRILNQPESKNLMQR
jgi:hypothetical protein